MEKFVRLGLSFDESAELLLEKGVRLMSLMNQVHSKPVNMVKQIVILSVGIYGLLNNLNINIINLFERKLGYFIENKILFSIFLNTLNNILFLKVITQLIQMT